MGDGLVRGAYVVQWWNDMGCCQIIILGAVEKIFSQKTKPTLKC